MSHQNQPGEQGKDFLQVSGDYAVIILLSIFPCFLVDKLKKGGAISTGVDFVAELLLAKQQQQQQQQQQQKSSDK